MKLLGGFLALFSMTVVSFAADFSQQKPQFTGEFLSKPTFVLNQKSAAKPLPESLNWKDALEKGTDVCYTVRTYRMVREGRDSDTTRPDGYSTCERASQFQVKKAIGQAVESH